MAADRAAAPSLDEHLEQLRRTYRRVGPVEASQALHEGALLVDIRPAAQRLSEGEVPGAIILERNVLEWRLAPTSDHRIPQAPRAGDARPVIVMCSEGYASTLAAVSLREVGVEGATDLIGGYQAWRRAGPAGPRATRPDPVPRPRGVSRPAGSKARRRPSP